MREQVEHRSQLLVALRIGENDVAAGRFETYTPELLTEIVAKAKKRASAGEKPKADVSP